MWFRFAFFLCVLAFAAGGKPLLDILDEAMDCSGKETWKWNAKSESCEKAKHKDCGFKEKQDCVEFAGVYCRAGLGAVTNKKCGPTKYFVWEPKEKKCIQKEFFTCGRKIDEAEITEEVCLAVAKTIC